MKNLSEIAEAIEYESERLCIERLGYTPSEWYTGGSDHNDDRLVADVVENTIVVSDGVAQGEYDGGIDGVKDFVKNWLDSLKG